MTLFRDLRPGAFFTYPEQVTILQKKSHTALRRETAHFVTGAYPGMDCFSEACSEVVELELEFVPGGE